MTTPPQLAAIVAEMRKAAADYSDHNGCAAFCNMSRDWADRLAALTTPEPDAAPYRAGDEVTFLHGGNDVAVVRQCWAAYGGWRVLAQIKGRENAVNKGMIDYPTHKVTRATPQSATPPAPVPAGEDGMLPDALVPVAKEWYVLCERRFYAFGEPCETETVL